MRRMNSSLRKEKAAQDARPVFLHFLLSSSLPAFHFPYHPAAKRSGLSTLYFPLPSFFFPLFTVNCLPPTVNFPQSSFPVMIAIFSSPMAFVIWISRGQAMVQL